MKTFLVKNLGIILVILGIICLVVYYFAVQSNYLLLISLSLEILGILLYILLNKKFD